MTGPRGPVRTKRSYPCYPVNLDLVGRDVLVIGGGQVAERKVESLIASGARVRVVSPEATARIQRWASKEKIRWHRRAYRTGWDERGAVLVVAATDDTAVNKTAFRAARKRGLFINVVDVPELCTATIPAVVTRGDLQIAVSTGGKSPAFSRRVREDLEKTFGEGHARLLRLLGELRLPIREAVKDPVARQALFLRMARLPVPRLLDRGRGEDGARKVAGVLSRHLPTREVRSLTARLVRPILAGRRPRAS